MSPSAHARPRPALRILFLAIVGVTVALGLEAAARYSAWRHDQRLMARWAEIDGRQSAPTGNVTNFGELIRPSPNPDIIYELIPNMDAVFLGGTVRTNAAGFRGPAVPLEKPDGVVRIVGLGDSVMFGWGVSEGETYLERLVEGLDRDIPLVEWQAVNTAVPGYNTVMELAVFEEYGLAYDPDLVIVNFVGNDFGLPNFIRREVDPFALDRSFFVERLSKRLAPDERGDELEWRAMFEGAPRPQGRFEWRPEKVPPRYEAHVGHDNYRRAIRRLKELSETHGFLLWILGHPGVFDLVRDLGEELDIPIATTYQTFLKGIEHNDLEGMRDPSLIYAYNDSHPSARGHSWIAMALGNALRERGALEELVRRRADPERLARIGLEPWPDE